MIKIALGILLGSWLVIGSFAVADKIATFRMERKQRRLNKKEKEN